MEFVRVSAPTAYRTVVADEAAASAAPRRRMVRPITVLLLAVHLSGCFHYVPVGATPVRQGTLVSLAINDRGRVALQERLGPGIRRIRGTLNEVTDSTIVLSLDAIEFADLNVPARMSGESVGIPRELVAEFRERRLSKSRTWLAGALVVGGVVLAAFIGINGFGGDGPSDRPDGGGGGESN